MKTALRILIANAAFVCCPAAMSDGPPIAPIGDSPPVEAVGGVSLPAVPAAVAAAAVQASAAAKGVSAEARDMDNMGGVGVAGGGAQETNITLTVAPGTTDLVRIARN